MTWQESDGVKPGRLIGAKVMTLQETKSKIEEAFKIIEQMSTEPHAVYIPECSIDQFIRDIKLWSNTPVDTSKKLTKYHLLTEKDFVGRTMFVGTAWGNIYKCPCGKLNVIDHHAPGWWTQGFYCQHCGCLLAFREGDVWCVAMANIATEDMIAFPNEEND